MIRRTFPVGMLQCNCSILTDPTSNEAIVIDPGDDIETILQHLKEMQARPVAIVHTHAHIDHVGATTALAKATGAPTYLHDGDTFLHQALATQAAMLGIPVPESEAMQHPLHDSQALTFGEFELGVLHTPGHTPGSVCFSVPGEDLCFSGDTLFLGSIGRTDLPGGDADIITDSIRQRLYSLNGSVEVVCGHGPNTTIDQERRTNPFVRG